MEADPVGDDKTFFTELVDALKRVAKGLDRELRASATGMLSWEHRELENLFALMLFSPIAGIPAPPSLLALELIPHAEQELLALLDRARESGDPLGEIFSVFEVT
jgi:hypothetical protein